MGWIEDAQTWMGEKYAALRGEEYKEAFAIMNNWNKLKNDMYEGRLITDFGISGGSDNLCRVGAGIEIGQRAAQLRAAGKAKEAQQLIDACLDLSSLRETADTVRKRISGGSNKDADKDEENIRRGIEIGLANPNADKWHILSEMDLKSGKFKPGYNNGYADFIKNNYTLGGDNKPHFSKKEGQAISTLIKSDICHDLNEALEFMSKYKERAPELAASAAGLKSEARGALDGKEALDLVIAIDQQEQKNLAMRKDLKEQHLLAKTDIKSRAEMAKTSGTVRGTQAKKQSAKPYVQPWKSTQKELPKTFDATKPFFKQGTGRE